MAKTTSAKDAPETQASAEDAAATAESAEQPAEGQEERAEARARFHQTLGEAMWLLFQSPDYRSVQIGAIERLVLPAMRRNQFTLFRDRDQAVGMASWALLNDAAERAYLETGHLSPNDWTSGDRLWIIHFVAPFGGQAALAAALKDRVIGDRDAWIASAMPGGRRKAPFAEVAKAWAEAAAKTAAKPAEKPADEQKTA